MTERIANMAVTAFDVLRKGVKGSVFWVGAIHVYQMVGTINLYENEGIANAFE